MFPLGSHDQGAGAGDRRRARASPSPPSPTRTTSASSPTATPAASSPGELGSPPGPGRRRRHRRDGGGARGHLRVHRRAAPRAGRRASGDQRPRYVLGIEPVSPHRDRSAPPTSPAWTRCGTGVPTWTGAAPELPFAAQVQLRAHAAAGGLRGERRRRTAACGSRSPTEQRGVAPGQSAVLYEPDPERGDRVLGQAAVATAGHGRA